MTPKAEAVNWALNRIRLNKLEIESLEILTEPIRICPGCEGWGKVQHWHAADDVENVVCEKCKGDGVIPKEKV